MILFKFLLFIFSILEKKGKKVNCSITQSQKCHQSSSLNTFSCSFILLWLTYCVEVKGNTEKPKPDPTNITQKNCGCPCVSDPLWSDTQVWANLKTLIFRDLADFEWTQMSIMRKSITKCPEVVSAERSCTSSARRRPAKNTSDENKHEILNKEN